MQHTNWDGFKSGIWQDEINVRDFIQTNYKEYVAYVFSLKSQIRGIKKGKSVFI